MNTILPTIVRVAALLFAVGAVAGLRAETPGTAEIPVLTEGSGNIQLEKLIAVHGVGLKKWVESQPSKELEVYIEGFQIPNAQILVTELRNDWISIYLCRDATNKASREAWNHILSRLSSITRKDGETLGVTLAKKGELPLVSSVRLPYKIASLAWLWVWALAMLILAAFLVWLGKASDVLRDEGVDPPQGRKPFSLARAQMAFWLFVTVAAYLFIYLVTSDTDTITGSVLGLIGISAATGFGAVVLDSAKRNSLLSQKIAAERTVTSLSARLAAGTALTPEEQAQLVEKTAEASRLAQALQPAPGRGFWWDLVSDGGGVSFHRLQIVVWTVIVGLIVTETVAHSLAMPDLSATMLGLMGISGGTYLGFKLPEVS